MAPAVLSHGSWTPEEDTHFKNDYFEKTDTPINHPSSVVPQVSRLDLEDYHSGSEEALVTDIVRSLKRSGGCIIRNMIPQKRLAQCEHEIRPYLNMIQQADGKYSENLILMYIHLIF
jgi:Protein of unknown function (DUF1479)